MSKKHKKKSILLNLSRRTKVIIGVVTVVIVVAFLAALTLIKINHQPPMPEPAILTDEQRARRDANVAQSQRDGAIRDSAAQALEQGNADRANQVYQSAIQSENDTTRKIKLTLDQSALLYDAGKYTEAINVAKGAESYSDDQFLVADWLSRLYEDQKQYALAAQYYTLAGKWAKSPTNKTALTKGYYDSQAARVSALVGVQ